MSGDPREELGRLSDAAPIALLPLRLETRFVDVGPVVELWVRVYPDDLWVDVFAPELAPGELVSGRAYWTARWRAAGRRSELRAAWRDLVRGHGAGRAAWVVRSYVPLGDEPADHVADEVVLVSVLTAPPDPAVQLAAEQHWARRWAAADDPAALAALDRQLELDLGAAAATAVRQDHRPVNLDEELAEAGADPTVRVRVVALVLPDPAAQATAASSWSRPASVQCFPERLRLVTVRGGKIDVDVLGEPVPQPLVVGPDPAAAPDAGIHLDADGRLVVPDDLSWLVDFPTAVKHGMGFRVPLQADQVAAGFDRLYVLGVRLDGDEVSGQAALSTLLRHHRYSTSGLEVLRQGAPTNNGPDDPSPYSRRDDADASFDAVHDAPRVSPAEPEGKLDGRWLTDLVGLDRDLLSDVVRADGTDAVEAQAMSRLLWPATLGSFLESLLAVRPTVAEPGRRAVLSDRTVDQLRAFFVRHVTGRGRLPSVRIGRQPYGVVPTTAQGRPTWLQSLPEDAEVDLVRRLLPVLAVARADWTGLVAAVSRLEPGRGSAASELLDVLGLQASSVDFSQRYAETADKHHNLLGLFGVEVAARAQALLLETARQGAQLLADLGGSEQALPDLLTKLFLGGANRLRGPVVDDAPLSETRPPAPVPGAASTYLRWLHEQALTSFERLRSEDGLDPPPRALLYLLAKYGIERAYGALGEQVLLRAGIVDRTTFDARRIEPAFVHVSPDATGLSESRWASLYTTAPQVTGNDLTLVHEYITEQLRSGLLPGELEDAVGALRLLDVPSARLERAFAEHLDCCSYRLDAWLSAVSTFQLERMRFVPGDDDARPGVHLGAYGWLLDVRRRDVVLPEASLPDAVVDTFTETGAPAVRQDPGSGGFVLAPTLDHAVTASVLRSGYLSASDRDAPGVLAVGLTSERVRAALALLEGVRNGQTLGALLGYQLERGLHERRSQPQLHTVVDDLRAAFPLRAGRLADAVAPPGTPVEALEARNVVDGQRLLDSARVSGQRTWPYGSPALATPAESLRLAVDAEVERLVDVYDAVSDLALAEGVHQSVRGNHERAAATLDAFSKGGLPPEPDVVSTPRSGTVVTHRVVLHLDPQAPAGATPRAQAEPALNAWLTAVLPPADRVGCLVRGPGVQRFVTQADLGLAAIDVLHVLDADADAGGAVLDDLLVDAFCAATGARPDGEVRLDHTVDIADRATFFQLTALVHSLRALVLGARAVTARDIAPPGARAPEQTAVLPAARLRPARDVLAALLVPLDTLLAAVSATDRTSADETAAAADGWLQALTAACAPAAAYGVAAAGSGGLRERRRSLLLAATAVAHDADADAAARLDAFDLGLGELDAAGPLPEAETVERLRRLERLVSTTATDPVPAPAVLRTEVQARADVLRVRQQAWRATAADPATTVRGIRDQVLAVLSTDPPQELLTGTAVDPGRVDAQVLALGDELARQAAALRDEVAGRVTACDGHLVAATAVDGDAAVTAVQDAGRALLGPGFAMVAAAVLPAAEAGVLDAAFGDQDELLQHLRDDLGREDPVDDWLHGLARVRPRLDNWQRVAVLSEAAHRRTGSAVPDLDPSIAQLPRAAGSGWMALEVPADQPRDLDYLTWTAISPMPLGAQVCALVLDEWTEVVPLPEHTAGLAFHFDRPASEPPQAVLLATPASGTGSWEYADVVGALDNALDLARLRAVEPDHLDASRYAPFLPTTVFPVYPVQISIMLNLAMNAERFAAFREG